jgi:predicted kinase
VVSQDSFRVDEDGNYRQDRDLEDDIKSRAKWIFREILKRADIHRAVLLVGVPGAGKSTWIETNQEPGVVYFDATLTNFKTRRKLVLIAKEVGKPVEAVVLDTPLYLCEERNNKRPRNRRVPEETMWEMAAQLHKERPSIAEGFAKVSFVEPPQ